MHTDTGTDRPARKTHRQRKQPGERLKAAVMELCDSKAVIRSHQERSWASITFAGSRHTLVLAFDGPEAVEAGESLIDLLPEHEFTIPGQLVADAAITEVDHRLDPPCLTVTCELLMLEES